MAFDLIYTSAPRGLKIGSKGFSTVAMTANMPAHCVQLCESMSGYVHVFGLNDPRYDENPVAWSHYRVKCGGRDYSICSRVSSHARDYSGRTNKIAHHLMLENPGETARLAGGPAALMSQGYHFQHVWDRNPELLQPVSRFGAVANVENFKAAAWEQHGFASEQAAVVANAVWQDPVYPVFILFDPANRINLLALIEDSLRLLPPARRWAVSFSTYFTSAIAGDDCGIRCCVKGSEAAAKAVWMQKAVILDLVEGTVSGHESLPKVKQRLHLAATKGVKPLWAEPEITAQSHVKPMQSAGAPGAPSPSAQAGRATGGGDLQPHALRRHGHQSATRGTILPKEKKFPVLIILSALLSVIMLATGAFMFYIKGKDGEPSGQEKKPLDSSPVVDAVPSITPDASEPSAQVPVIKSESGNVTDPDQDFPTNVVSDDSPPDDATPDQADLAAAPEPSGREETWPQEDEVVTPEVTFKSIRQDDVPDEMIPWGDDIVAVSFIRSDGSYGEVNISDTGVELRAASSSGKSIGSHSGGYLRDIYEVMLLKIQRTKHINFYFVYNNEIESTILVKNTVDQKSQLVRHKAAEFIHLIGSKLQFQLVGRDDTARRQTEKNIPINSEGFDFTRLYIEGMGMLKAECSNRFDSRKKEEILKIQKIKNEYESSIKHEKGDESIRDKIDQNIIRDRNSVIDEFRGILVDDKYNNIHVVKWLLNTNSSVVAKAHKKHVENEGGRKKSTLTSGGSIRLEGHLLQPIVEDVVRSMKYSDMPEWFDVCEVMVDDFYENEKLNCIRNKPKVLSIGYQDAANPKVLVFRFDVQFIYTGK